MQAVAGTFTFDDIAFTQQQGGKYLTEPTDGFIVISNAVYIRMLTMSELKTKLNFEMPTNYNGQVTIANGRPVILSEFYPENLNETGLNTSGGNNNTTGFTVYNGKQFKIGNRRRDRVRLVFDDLTGYYYIVATCRKDFQTMENRRAGYTPAANAISIDLTAIVCIGVDMAVSPFALVSLADTKAFLGLTDDDTNRDTWLEGEINRISQRIERWCDRLIRARRYREEFNPHDLYQDYTLHLDKTPIIEVQQLFSDGRRQFGRQRVG